MGRLFGSDGCTAHHWGTGAIQREWRVEALPGIHAGYAVEELRRYRCKHDGCAETKSEWYRVDHAETLSDAYDALAYHLGERADG